MFWNTIQFVLSFDVFSKLCCKCRTPSLPFLNAYMRIKVKIGFWVLLDSSDWSETDKVSKCNFWMDFVSNLNNGKLILFLLSAESFVSVEISSAYFIIHNCVFAAALDLRHCHSIKFLFCMNEQFSILAFRFG